jgi:hypothetical protein
MIDGNPTTMILGSAVSTGVVALSLLGVEATMADHPGTWIGVVGTTIGTIGIVVQLVINARYNAERIEMKMRLERSEKDIVECQNDRALIRAELNALRTDLMHRANG